jgi:outer membrane protein
MTVSTRSIIGALALCIAVNAGAGAQPSAPVSAPRAITLDEAIRLAQINSPQAVQARGSQRTARMARTAATLAFVPNISTSVASTWQRGQRIGQTGSLIDFTGPSKSFNDGISLNMEIFDGGRRFHDISAARAGVEAADAGELSMRFLLAQQVKEQYYNVLAARESHSAAQAQIAEAEQQLRAATARLHAGAAIRSDSLRSTVLLGSAQLALIAAETELTSANAALTRAVGSDEAVTAADEPADVPLPALDVEALQPLLENSPDVTQARAQLRSATAAVRSARTGYLPTISANYSRSGNGFDARYGFDSQFAYSSSLRLSFSLPVFNQLTREETALRANVAEDQAEANLRDARLRVRQELTDLVGQLRSGQQRVRVQQASVTAAEEDLRIQQQRYELGASSLLDVVQSQTQLVEARGGLITARFDFRVARARLEALLARDLGSL